MEKSMKKLRPIFLALLIGALSTLSTSVYAATPEDLIKDSDNALHMLTKTNPLASDVAKKARAILIFPNIVKAGLIFGGAYGEGVLKDGDKIDGFYNSITGS